MLTLPYKVIRQLKKGETVIVSRPRLAGDVLQTIQKPNVRDRKYDHNGKPRTNPDAVYPCLQVFSTTSGRARFTQWRRYGTRHSVPMRENEKAVCMFIITDIQPFGDEWWRLTIKLHEPLG